MLGRLTAADGPLQPRPGGRRASPGAVHRDREWLHAFREKLFPYADKSAVYVNWMSSYDDQRFRNTYGPAKYDRLARIKANYDPDNALHHNANITTAPTA
jgi:FAD/FMN-containing dehydrogenase